jgi:L-ascorbate metabolism protein UlaG (beta-lactamase superfamily)
MMQRTRMSETSRTICLFALMLISMSAANAEGPAIERLTWAGIKWMSGGTTVFIDAVGTDLWNGDAPEGLVPVTTDTRRRYALVTHTHNDHFDVDTLKEVLGERGYVICHESEAAYIASRGLKVIAAKTWEPVLRGGFVFTAVPAEDGLGTHQVSWIVANSEHRIIHGGDSLWHGQWQTIGLQYGPFDVAFLPINGARVQQEEAFETPAVMTPAQAVDAAILLRANLLVPIHYGLNDPPDYVEVEDPLGTLQQAALRRGQAIRHLRPGERIDVEAQDLQD